MARLLVVDDSLSVRKAIERVLAQRGHEIEVAEDVARAIAKLKVADFDLAIVDLILPDAEGYEVVTFARSEARLGRPVPCLCISAIVDALTEERCVAVGAVGILKKPFAAEDLVAAVESRLALDLEATSPDLGATSSPLAERWRERRAELGAMVGEAENFPGVAFVAVTDAEGSVIAEVAPPAASMRSLSEARRRELLGLASRVTTEVRAGAISRLVLDAPDSTLLVEPLDEGEVLVLCVEASILLGMARLYLRRMLARLEATEAPSAIRPPSVVPSLKEQRP